MHNLHNFRFLIVKHPLLILPPSWGGMLNCAEREIALHGLWPAGQPAML